MKYLFAWALGFAMCAALILTYQTAKKTSVLVIDEEGSPRQAVGFPSKSHPVTQDEAKNLCDLWMHEFEITIAAQPHRFQITNQEEHRLLRRPTWRLFFSYITLAPTSEVSISDLDAMNTQTVSWELRGPGEAHFQGIDNAQEITKRVTAIMDNWRD
jgi:hypothetical protein